MKQHATHPWLVLVLVCLAQFMVVLDATVVNVALPAIQRDLRMSEPCCRAFCRPRSGWGSRSCR